MPANVTTKDSLKVLNDLERGIAELSGLADIRDAVNKALNLNIDPMEVVDSMSRGLVEVGRRYEEKEYFLMELILAGNIASEVMTLLKPHLAVGGGASMGKVVIGTVEGDLHDIGKNIVITMLSSVGFEVVDLGVDVSADKFIEAVLREKPDILAMSILLSIGLPRLAEVMSKLKEESIRNSVKVMVGGRPVTKEFAQEIGADAYGADAVAAMKIAQRWVGG